jgi:hypothetical protein
MHGESVLEFDHHDDETAVHNIYNDERGDEYNNTTVSYDNVNQAQAVSTVLSISEEEEVIVILLVIDVTLTWSSSFMEHSQMLFLILLKLYRIKKDGKYLV